jgi:hypothetical protein
MSIMPEVPQQTAFDEQSLVTWHYRDGSKHIPIPAVVVRQEREGVIIKARLQDVMKELLVDPKELVAR